MPNTRAIVGDRETSAAAGACSPLWQIYVFTCVAVSRRTGKRVKENAVVSLLGRSRGRVEKLGSRERSALYSGAEVGFAGRFPRRLRLARESSRLCTKLCDGSIKKFANQNGAVPLWGEEEGKVYICMKHAATAVHEIGFLTDANRA